MATASLRGAAASASEGSSSVTGDVIAILPAFPAPGAASFFPKMNPAIDRKPAPTAVRMSPPRVSTSATR
jgi:hypothetical protein